MVSVTNRYYTGCNS